MSREPDNILVECADVALSFSGRRIIEGFRLKIARGDRIAFLGPSGCGKSTLLNLISGLLEPTSGKVIRNLPVSKISFVFQDASLFPWKNVCENLEMVNDLMRQTRLSKTDLDERIKGLLQQVGLIERANAFPDQLSGGMKMRVALARALLNSPELLLLDEPFSALDDITRERLQEDLLKLNEANGSAFVMVTHNIDEAALLCNRIYVFAQDGRVVKEFASVVDSSSANAIARRESHELAQFRNEVRGLWNPQQGAGGVHA
jgi:NitT/TauT family transport system ATP-binding protein